MSTKSPGRARVSTAIAFAWAYGLLIIGSTAWAQSPVNDHAPLPTAPAATTSAAPASPAPLTSQVLPANTVIELEMVDAVSSRTSKRNDFFKLRVAADVKSGDVVLIPAGTPAVGQIVHAQKSSGGGKAGELILAARYIDTPQGQVKLHSSFGAAGKNRVQASLWFGYLVKGKDVELPVGSPLSARLAADTSFVATP